MYSQEKSDLFQQPTEFYERKDEPPNACLCRVTTYSGKLRICPSRTKESEQAPHHT